MSERYIERSRLNPRQFPLNCPVKLAAGALLEDTRQPRLVGQLKFTPAKRMVTALSVTLHCEGTAETDLPFRYEALSAAPGQPFGQYTAIVLPAGTTAFHVTVDTVTFKDGSQWSRAEEEARERVRQESAALREEQRHRAKREAAEKAAAMKAAAEEKLAQKKAELQYKTEEKQAEKAEAPADTAPAKSKGKGIAVVAAMLVVVIIAGAILVPKLPKDDSTDTTGDTAESPAEVIGDSASIPTAKPTPTPKPADTDFGETGDIAAVYLTKDDSGYYLLTPDQITPYLENATTTCAWMGQKLGDDVLTYLKDSFSFAWFIGAGGPNNGISGDGTMYPQGNGDLPETVCILAFNGYENTLVGYFIGIPEQYDKDTIRFDMILCDYDLLDLYEQERTAFDADKDFLYENYISPDSDFKALGAKYYLQGYYTCKTRNLENDDIQAYHLWQEATSADHIEDFVRPISNLEERLSRNYNRDGTMFFLLLDKSYRPIGVTWQ